jgi:CzcA family heavy metal efflux pump
MTMIAGIIHSSLKFRFLILIIAILMMIAGATQLQAMPVDVFPEFAPPYVEVQTEALGLSALEVEQLITVPLEELLTGVPWLQTLRSNSVPGLSSILLIFEPGTNLMRARQVVQERLTQAHALPTKNVSKPPAMLQPLSATSRVMMIGLSSDELSLIDLSVLARWTISPRLMGVPGVANVTLWGERKRQLQVLVDPERLRAHGVTLQQIIRTTGDSLWVSPLGFLNASTPGITGGFIDTPQQRLGIRHVLPISSPEDLAQVTVAGTQLRLGDVADVVEHHQPLIGDAILKDGPGLLLIVEKFPGSNTLEVTRGVEKALHLLQPGLPGLKIDTSLFRPATFIELALGNLKNTLLLGALLMVLVLAAFLYNWRATLISIVVIPLALLVAGLVLYLQGVTLNIMLLAGLALALGAVVDDAVIDIENIARRLRAQRRLGSHLPVTTIILEASHEMRGAMIYATLILVLTGLPILFLEGVAGAFFRPLALGYALALLASMLIALTVTPALSLILLAQTPLEKNESPLARWLQQRHSAVLARTTRTPHPAYLTFGALCLAGLVIWPFLGQQTLLPAFKETDVMIRWEGAPGTSHPEMIRSATRVGDELQAIPGIRNFGAHVGRAVLGDQVVGINSAELWVNLQPTDNYHTTVAAIQATVDGYPGLSHDVRSYLQETVRQVLTGSSDAVVVRLYGPDLGLLQQKAKEVQEKLSQIDGIVDLHIEAQVEQPQVEIQVNLDAAQRYGLKPGDVRRVAATLINGLEVGNLFEEQKVFEVVVMGVPEMRHSLTNLRELPIDIPGGGQVRLEEVAEVRIVASPNLISHEGTSRRIDIGFNVRGQNLGAVVSEVEQRLQETAFPLEYHPELLGEYAEQQAARNRLLGVALAAALGIFLLLQAAFGSWRLAILTFLILPVALVGGLLALAISGEVISLGALVGFLLVLGLMARNSLMLIRHYQHLEQVEGEPFGPELVLRGTRERVAPILMTLFTLSLALLPVIIAGNIPGLEIMYPMAIVVLGGLITSLIINLFIVPSLYLRLAAKPEPELWSSAQIERRGAAERRQAPGPAVAIELTPSLPIKAQATSKRASKI